MIQPPYLKKGDKIAIVSPARSITFEEVHPSIRVLQKNGLEVVLGSHVFSRHQQFAGTDAQRARDFQQMLDDDSIRAILCSRGGYGSLRIIDRLDFTRFSEHPKWVIGYSDVTVFHAHFHERLKSETLHATMPKNILSELPDDSVGTMINALFGHRISYSYPGSPQSREGLAEGSLIGGNLSILVSLMGSVSEVNTDGKILFLEDVDEYLYHLDRMMMNLKRAGKLSRLKGLVVGGLSGMNDNAIPFGKTPVEIVAEAVSEYKYPVCFDFQAGHLDKNLAMIFGRKIRLFVGKKIEISFY